MGSSTHSPKTGLPKGQEVDNGYLNETDSIFSVSSFSGVKTLDDVFKVIDDVIAEGRESELKGKKIALPPKTIRNIVRTDKRDNSDLGKALKVISKAKPTSQKGISKLGGMPGSFAAISNKKPNELQKYFSDEFVGRSEKEIISSAHYEANRIESSKVYEIKDEDGLFEASAIFLLAAINYGQIKEKLDLVGVELDQKTIREFVTEAKDQLSENINISISNFDKTELSDFLGESNV